MSADLESRVKALEALAAGQEPNSIKKFLKGGFVFKNWLKAFLFGSLFLIMLFVFSSIYTTVKGLVGPKAASAASGDHKTGDTAIQSAGGAVLQVDSHATSSVSESNQNTWMPFANGLFGAFGSQGKIQGDRVKPTEN